MSIDGNFTSRGFGFVSFESSKVAQKAIKEANGKSHSKLGDHSDSETAAEQAQEDDDKKLQVTEFLSKQDRNGTMKPKCSTNLYIKNFPVKDAGEFGETDLQELFSTFGEIASVAIMRDAENNSKGFGFVCFKEWQDAHKALTQFAEDRANQKSTVYVAEFKNKEQREKELQKRTYQFKKSMQFLNLIVKNVESTATEDDLRKFFDQFGQVHGVKILAEAQCAFVSFKDRESARSAKAACSQHQFSGRILYANFCEPKESRQLT